MTIPARICVPTRLFAVEPGTPSEFYPLAFVSPLKDDLASPSYIPPSQGSDKGNGLSKNCGHKEN